MALRKRVGALLLASLLTGCGSRTPGGGFHPSGTAPADGSSAGSPAAAASPGNGSPGAGGPAPKTPQAALAAYRSYQLAYERAYEANDASVLDPVAMDPLLAKISKDLAKVRGQGVIWRFHNVLNPVVQGTSSDGARVVILDCVRTLGSYRYDAKTGKRLGSWRGGTFEYQATMRYSNDTWKISEAAEGGKC
jgi:hypothetical protein